MCCRLRWASYDTEARPAADSRTAEQHPCGAVQSLWNAYLRSLPGLLLLTAGGWSTESSRRYSKRCQLGGSPPQKTSVLCVAPSLCCARPEGLCRVLALVIFCQETRHCCALLLNSCAKRADAATRSSPIPCSPGCSFDPEDLTIAAWMAWQGSLQVTESRAPGRCEVVDVVNSRPRISVWAARQPLKVVDLPSVMQPMLGSIRRESGRIWNACYLTPARCRGKSVVRGRDPVGW